MNHKLSPSLLPPPTHPPTFSLQKRKKNTLKYEQICMKTSHEDSMEKSHKNTGNLDSKTFGHERKEGKRRTEQTPSTAPKNGITRLGVRRRSSPWKGECKEVVVWLMRERA